MMIIIIITIDFNFLRIWWIILSGIIIIYAGQTYANLIFEII